MIWETIRSKRSQSIWSGCVWLTAVSTPSSQQAYRAAAPCRMWERASLPSPGCSNARLIALARRTASAEGAYGLHTDFSCAASCRAVCASSSSFPTTNAFLQAEHFRWTFPVEQMPAHWEIIPSKYLFHNSDKRKCEGDQQLTASQKHGIITQQEYMERENSKIVFANQGLENWKHVEPYDFVISLRSFQGGLEMSETTGCITWHYVVLKANKPICPRFYKWLFKSSAYINALQGTCNFIRDGQDLRFSNFAQVPLYEPPLSEQEDIASYLDMKCSQIDSISDQKKEQLTVLEAYKKSLIYEYVTGKKEVPVQ